MVLLVLIDVALTKRIFIYSSGVCQGARARPARPGGGRRKLARAC